jgi:hypothetical protein
MCIVLLLTKTVEVLHYKGILEQGFRPELIGAFAFLRF